MFIKTKWKIWVMMLIIAVGLKFGLTFFKNFVETKKQDAIVSEVRIDFQEEDAKYKNIVAEKKIKVDGKNYKIIATSDDPDLIITKSDKKLEGYTKKENFLYIPLIMVANPKFQQSENFFNKIDSYQYEKDFRLILKAMEEGKTWRDIGISSTSVVENPKDEVSLIIPNEYDKSYQEIKDYILLALNDYKEPTEDEIPDLLKRTNAILAKCEKVDNISTLFNQSTWFKGIILCEENIIAKERSSFTGNCIVISTGKTKRSRYNVYMKNSNIEDLISLITNIGFLEKTGYRSNDVNVSKSASYKYSFQVFDFIDVDVKYPDGIDLDVKSVETAKNEKTEVKETKETEETTESEETNESEEYEDEKEEKSHAVDIFFMVLLIGFVCIFVMPLIIYMFDL